MNDRCCVTSPLGTLMFDDRPPALPVYAVTMNGGAFLVHAHGRVPFRVGGGCGFRVFGRDGAVVFSSALPPDFDPYDPAADPGCLDVVVDVTLIGRSASIGRVSDGLG